MDAVMTNSISTSAPSPATPLPHDQRTADAQAALGQLKGLTKKMKTDRHDAAAQQLQMLLAQLHSMAALNSKSSPAYAALARKIAAAARAVAQAGQPVPAAANAAAGDAVTNPKATGADAAAKTSVDIKLDPTARSADRDLLRSAQDGIDLIRTMLDRRTDDKKSDQWRRQVDSAGSSVAASQASISPAAPTGGTLDLSV
jgi:hypothetical protein